MKVHGRAYRTIWLNDDGCGRRRRRPALAAACVSRLDAAHVADAATAIRDMWVRGAPADRRHGRLWDRARDAREPGDAALAAAWERCTPRGRRRSTCAGPWTPMRGRLRPLEPAKRAAAAYAQRRGDRRRGRGDQPRHRPQRPRHLSRPGARKSPVEPQCSHPLQRRLAGDGRLGHGARADLHRDGGGLPVHVWVDETRPRNQGASLTAWELNKHGVAAHRRRRQRRRPSHAARSCRSGHRRHRPHHRHGDVCNKIGTYLKALAARDNGVPFYVALPSPTIDWTVRDGVKEIPIEERSADEVDFVRASPTTAHGDARSHFPRRQPRRQPRLRRHPARLVTGLITERGVAQASRRG